LYHTHLLFKNAHINQCRNLVKIFKCERVYSSQNGHRSRDFGHQRRWRSVSRYIYCAGTMEFLVDSFAISVLLSDRLLINFLMSTLVNGLSRCADSFSVMFSISVSLINFYTLFLNLNLSKIVLLFLNLNYDLWTLAFI